MDPITDNKGFRIGRAELDKWVVALIESATQVIAPVERRGVRAFRVLGSPQELCLANGKTQWSPKEYLFPRTETVFSYETVDGEIKLSDPPPTSSDRVLFGCGPATPPAGLHRRGAEPGRHLCQRRARTVIVALTCPEAEPECFCASVGGAPDGTDGSDVQLVPLADACSCARSPRVARFWSAQPARSGKPLPTRTGRRRRSKVNASLEACAAPPWLVTGRRASRSASSHRPGAASQKLRRLQHLHLRLPVLHLLQRGGRGQRGVRKPLPVLDSCSYGLFTLHASGHNPRPDQASRYRQRVLHKFSYFRKPTAGRTCAWGAGVAPSTARWAWTFTRRFTP